MEKDGLPRYTRVDEFAVSRNRRRHRRRAVRLFLTVCLAFVLYSHWSTSSQHVQEPASLLSKERLTSEHATCSKLRSSPHDPSGTRERNARYVDGHKSMLIRNATVWTGEPAPGTTPEEAHVGKAYAWIHADVLMEHGLIKRVEAEISAASLPADCEVYEANGRMLTAGIVDMHSHTGVSPLPELSSGSDDNELSSDITPYVRSIDGLNPLDHQLQVIKSGGVTTSLVLPGSGNNMGGEAYVIKHAVGKPDGRTNISAEDMLADPEHNWRYMKMACGENPKRVYGQVGRGFGPFSRLGEAWYFRHAFEQASALVAAQNDWCAAADTVGPEKMTSYLPLDLQWESLGALLRGQVLLNTHCYTIPDLEAFVRHTNEFKFSVRAFHHAHQTYLVPEILKRAYGDRPPAAALFADNMNYKVESYTASEQAGKILYENGITPVYVSDNPVLNAQHVVFEGAKAYKNGLPYHVALAGVTSASAELLGLGERIGKVQAGYDADVVVWDSDPLSVGATPVQVWIDGVPQFDKPFELAKPISKPMDLMMGLQETPTSVAERKDVIFSGVSKFLLQGQEQTTKSDEVGHIVVRNGSIICFGSCQHEVMSANADGIDILNLNNGYITPAFSAFGSSLGLVGIQLEGETRDGDSSESSFSSAVDGLVLDGKNLNAAYSHGITRAISAPTFNSDGQKGVSVGFRTGASNAYEKGAVWADEVALHYTLTSSAKEGKTPSLSSAVAALRAKLIRATAALKSAAADRSVEEDELVKVVQGKLPIVILAHSVDIIAALLRLKTEVDAAITASTKMRLIILGGAESHLLATELAKADVSVVLAPLLSYSKTWDQRRSLTGAPLTNGTAVDVLHSAGVKVVIGTVEDWETRDLALLAGIAHTNSGGRISENEALKMVSSNVYDVLDLQQETGDSLREFVVHDGNPLQIGSRVRAVADGRGSLTVWT